MRCCVRPVLCSKEGGFARLAALARLRRAELYFADAQLDASLREAQYVADVFADQEDLPHLAQTMLLQGRIADVQGDIDTAYELCDQALDVAQGQGLLNLRYLCYDLLGQLAERRGDLEAAAAYYDRAVQGIDEMQSRLVLDERTSFLEDKGSIYQRAMVLALRRGNQDQALNYVEKAKSRVLGDYLRNNIDIRLHADDWAGEVIFEDLARLRESKPGSAQLCIIPKTRPSSVIPLLCVSRPLDQSRRGRRCRFANATLNNC